MANNPASTRRSTLSCARADRWPRSEIPASPPPAAPTVLGFMPT